MLILILGNIRAFAPDEQSYVDAFNNLYGSDFSLASYGGWWNAQINFLRILYIPPKIFSFLPISDLTLLRIYSCSLFLLGLLLLVRYSNLAQSKLGKVAIFLFAFTPSTFLWTTLAIKESFIFFFLIIFFVGLRFIISSLLVQGFLICFISGYALLNLKGYLYVVLTLAVLLVIFFRAVTSFNLAKPTMLVLIAVILPYSLAPATSALMIESAIGFSNKLSDFRVVDEIYQPDSTQPDSTQPDSTQPESTPPDSTQPDSTQPPGNLGMTMNLLTYEQNQNSAFNAALKILHLDDFLENKARGYRNLSPVELDKVRSLDPANPTDLGPFIEGVMSFLFYPNVFRNNGSPILDLLGLESLIWVSLYVIFFIGVLKNRSEFRRLDTRCVLVFSFGFLLMSEMTEINLGTAIRHRSVLALLIVILISKLVTNKNSQAKI
jgi:hypothetical protein